MPSLPFADNFIAGGILSWALPALVLIAIALWYTRTVMRMSGARVVERVEAVINPDPEVAAATPGPGALAATAPPADEPLALPGAGGPLPGTEGPVPGALTGTETGTAPGEGATPLADPLPPGREPDAGRG